MPVAVALKHDPDAATLPQVVASGRGMLAEQILELAFAHGVKVRQDSDLAQILAVLDLDSDIPPEAFAAVAEILVYVYRANAAAPPVISAPSSAVTGTPAPDAAPLLPPPSSGKFLP